MSNTSHEAAHEAAHEAWERLLDGLEADILTAEAQLAGGVPAEPMPWTPPVGMSPLPAELRARAVGLQQRRRQVIDQMAKTLVHLRRQRAVTKRLGATTAAPRRPLYIDRTA